MPARSGGARNSWQNRAVLRRRSACSLRSKVAAAVLGCALAAAGASRAAPAGATLAAAAQELVGVGQGVYVESSDGTVLVAQAADLAVHPASVSKVPTTLALLRTLGPGHQFETGFAASGPVVGGVVQGDLVVDASGDPYLVDENALLVLEALRDGGVREVRGRLVVRGPFIFDWESQGAGDRLRRVLAGGAPAAAWEAIRGGGSAPARPPAIRFQDDPRAARAAETLLVTHRSQPLVPLVKALNGYSNNVFAPFAAAAGGVDQVEAIARASVPAEMRDEIVLGDGAGASPRNRLSPRATVALLRALDAELARSDRTLADVLPVSGVDEGTLRHRLDGPGERGVVTGKTGTYGDYGASALVGAVRTRSRGTVYFAVLNHGVPVEAARERQDAFVRALLAEVDPEPWPYVRDEAPAFTRAKVVPTAALAADHAAAR